MENIWIETTRKLFLKSGKVGLIPLLTYDILVRNGEIDLSGEEIQILKEKAEERMLWDASRQGTRAVKDLAHLKNSKLYAKVLTDECKRQAVAEYFIKQQAIDNF